jgi:hypothetical protein
VARSSNINFEVGIRAATEQGEDGLDDAFGEGTDNAGEGRADDHAGGEIDDIAFEDKFFEFVKHRYLG